MLASAKLNGKTMPCAFLKNPYNPKTHVKFCVSIIVSKDYGGIFAAQEILAKYNHAIGVYSFLLHEHDGLLNAATIKTYPD